MIPMLALLSRATAHTCFADASVISVSGAIRRHQHSNNLANLPRTGRSRCGDVRSLSMVAPPDASAPGPGAAGGRRLCVAPMMDWTDKYDRYFLRQMSKHAWLYTEMVTTGAIIHGDQDRHLLFDPSEHPIAVQLGGSDPADLAKCAAIAEGSLAYPARPRAATGAAAPAPPDAPRRHGRSAGTDTTKSTSTWAAHPSASPRVPSVQPAPRPPCDPICTPRTLTTPAPPALQARVSWPSQTSWRSASRR